MFDLKRPCVNCPFRKGQGKLFEMPRLRLKEIFGAVAFQCHKTVDYDEFDDPEKRQGKRPQQCAGLMSILVRADRPNTIMQVAIRLGHLDPAKLDHADVYKTMATAIAAHGKHADSRPGERLPQSPPNRRRGLPRVILTREELTP
jgi:hypothetical protein